MVKTLLTAAAFIVLSAGVTLAQDIEKGATVFKQCAVCHKIGPGATNLVGPELNGLDGRHSGSVADSIIPMPIRILASSGVSRHSGNTSRIRRQKSPAQK